MLSLLSILLNAAAGFCIFVFMLIGRLLHIPDSRAKNCVILAVLGLCVLGPAFAASRLPGAPLLLIAAGVVGLTLGIEGGKMALARVWRGSPPIGSLVHRVHLLRPVTTTDLDTHRFEVSIPRWKGSRLRIAHLSDLHVTPGLPLDYYRRVFDAVDAAAPDLCFITGDFVSHEGHLELLAQVLRPAGRLGSFAVLGNHDFWIGAESVASVVRNAGIDLLIGASRAIGHRGAPVRITGCNEPWLPRFTVSPPVENESLHLMLAHTPDNIFRLAREAADCVFAGHCHAGQFRLPPVGSLVVPSVYGRLFDHGHFNIRGVHLFVTSGIGSATPPVRLYCRPDIFIVDINPDTPGEDERSS